MLKDIFIARQTITTTSQQDSDNPFMERVVLPDGQVMFVPHGNLAAAKAVLAARNAALRRIAEHKQGAHEIVFLQERVQKGRRAS